MSERKAINKYYPADYDPQEAEKAARKLAKQLKHKNNGSVTVRLMTPFSMRCSKCDEFIARSRKFNAKKEPLQERYLGSVRMFRFTLRCPRCSGAITFRTDPASADYVMEAGGVRNFERDKTGKPGNETETGKPTNETVDETLARLAREQEEEEAEKQKQQRTKDGRKGGDSLASGADKMEALEERLVKLQREQEAAAEIEALRQTNRARMGRANALHSGSGDREGPTADAEAAADTDAEAEAERLAERAFANSARAETTIPTAYQESTIPTIQQEGVVDNAARTVPSDAELQSVRQLVAQKPKIRLGKKGKGKGGNALGVVLKRK
ncbi:mRNA splicing protein [Maudiozyma humilis]|uniref:Splicing factor YJU2 n=1 Tax=Maudiozyma humilis TaxID=51915 RepID=A0AAV5RQ05_MAUHU|nr:mRNA splicing protein [Kazachstania humilis]